MTERAILFDTRSIQRYIFSGNTLKTNIGASYLVDHIFEDILLGDILSEENRKRYDIESVDFDSWKSVKAPKVSSSSGKKKKKRKRAKVRIIRLSLKQFRKTYHRKKLVRKYPWTLFQPIVM
ncbi:hypothetical protein [uncultured Megasphaera sp.]|jgi:hypothetical protein|uniref:hypothetical protein n=1 Tax=uncultured Megasphaera sp. TaxID=165188 RepID=UPI0025DC1F21|nr:hypothetical protein [uncultured Megasphaera sp.]